MADSWHEIIRRYSLATLCVVGPILFGFGGDLFAAHWLLPPNEHVKIEHRYQRAKPSDPKNAESAASKTAAPPASLSAASTNAMERAPDVSAAGAKDAPKPASAEKSDGGLSEFLMIGAQYHGRIVYAVASAFIYLISAAVLIFAGSVIWRSWGGAATLGTLAAFVIVAGLFAQLIPQGRLLIVENLLNDADAFSGQLKVHDGTGDAAAALVIINTTISFAAIGMLLAALFVLSVRPKDPAVVELGSLQTRLTLLRIALGLGSAFLVIGVLAQKALMEWPLSLILGGQADGLRLLANALTLQVGAQGTIALIAAFGPAIAAWSLDAAEFKTRAPQTSPNQTDPQHGNRVSGKSRSTELLAFAPLSAIASFLALLAPLLTSPIIDAIKKLLSLAP